MLRNGETGDWIGTFQGHKGAVWACILNDPAFVAATASADFTARVWNAVTGDEALNLPHKHIVRTVDFEKGDTATRLVTGGAERIVRIFDLAREDAAPTEFGGCRDNIRCIKWARDSSTLLVSYLDASNIDVWDIRSGNIVRTLESEGAVSSIELVDEKTSGCSSSYIVTSDGAGFTLRNAQTFDVTKQHKIEDYEVKSASYYPDKGKFVAGGSDMWVHLYDFDTGKEIECGRGHHGPVHCVRFAPGGATYASGSEDGTIRIWKTDHASDAANGVESDKMEDTADPPQK